MPLEKYVMADVPQDIRSYLDSELRKIQHTLDALTPGDTLFTPVINGLTVAGVGTYGVQSGSYTRVGQQIHVRYALNLTTHTGTGILTLPLPIKAQVGIGFGACDTNLAGGGQIVSLASTIGPTGVLVLRTAGPPPANVLMPAAGTPFTLNASFIYQADNAA